MSNYLPKNHGVFSILLTKKVKLINKKGVHTLGLSESAYKLPQFSSGVTKTSIFILSADAIKAKLSENYSIVQGCRKTYLSGSHYPRLYNIFKLLWFFYKFRYYGKGLKIKKGTKNALVLFNLGASHVSKLYFNTDKTSIMRTRKNTYTVISHSVTNKVTSHFMYAIRPYNLYTRRGLRLNRQSVCRRFGKVSQVASKKR